MALFGNSWIRCFDTLVPSPGCRERFQDKEVTDIFFLPEVVWSMLNFREISKNIEDFKFTVDA